MDGWLVGKYGFAKNAVEFGPISQYASACMSCHSLQASGYVCTYMTTMKGISPKSYYYFRRAQIQIVVRTPTLVKCSNAVYANLEGFLSVYKDHLQESWIKIVNRGFAACTTYVRIPHWNLRIYLMQRPSQNQRQMSWKNTGKYSLDHWIWDTQLTGQAVLTYCHIILNK